MAATPFVVILLFVLGIGALEAMDWLTHRIQYIRARNWRQRERERTQYRIDAQPTDDWLTENWQFYTGSPELPVVANCGLLLYQTAQSNPIVYVPGADLAGDAYVRPFVIFNIAEWETAHTMEYIRFDLSVGAAAPILSSTGLYRLLPGDTFVAAERWLPIDAAAVNIQDWKLRIYTGEMLLHIEDFRVISGGGRFRQYLDGDGELSDQLLAALDDAPAKRQTSLDELLR